MKTYLDDENVVETYLPYDPAFQVWLDANADGFVTLSFRQPTSLYRMLHRAKCIHVQPSTFDEQASRKFSVACAQSEETLEVWSSHPVRKLCRCEACFAGGDSSDLETRLLQILTEGSSVFANWKAFRYGFRPIEITEQSLYTDMHIVASSDDGGESFDLVNHLADPLAIGVKPAIILRLTNCVPNVWLKRDETDTSRYHGGGIDDEIAAMLSLCLGIRMAAGPMTRSFRPDTEEYGQPIAFACHETPSWSPPNNGYTIPHAAGPHGYNRFTGKNWHAQRSLLDIPLLRTLYRLKPKSAVALVRACRMYQNALWIAESEPELAWLLLVSAVEVAASHWRTSKEKPVEKLRNAKPKLVEILEPHGEALLKQVAGQLADLVGSTRKFVRFLTEFLPAHPSDRPPPYYQHSWELEDLKNSFCKIYSYRSRALHAGTPFPLPMCRPPRFVEDRWSEVPDGLSATAMRGQWTREDTPMLLHLFEYIVRNALLKWWQSMVAVSDTDTQATATEEKVEVMTVDAPATETAS